MPKIITAADIAAMAASGSTSGNCCTGESSVVFFAKMSDKLLDMVKSLQEQFEELKKCQNATIAKGAMLAEIETPQMVLGVGQEYLEYIKRHGPPHEGIFEKHLLNMIRAQLGIVVFPKCDDGDSSDDDGKKKHKHKHKH